jgi:hypothetical protein
VGRVITTRPLSSFDRDFAPLDATVDTADEIHVTG